MSAQEGFWEDLFTHSTPWIINVIWRLRRTAGLEISDCVRV